MIRLKRGQGATEYLVLLAVVLIVALVSVALLGFFPGMASDAKMTQSQSYWRGEARPFAILDHSIASTSGTFILQNTEAGGTYTMTNLSIGGGFNATSITFAPGETKTVIINGSTIGGTYSAGAIYDVQVNITYTTPNGVSSKQYGSKNLVGRFV